MWTHRYKKAFIHGHCDRDECTIQLENGNDFSDGSFIKKFRSYRAAQLGITRELAKIA